MNGESPRPTNRKNLLLTFLILILASAPSVWVFINRWLDTSFAYRLEYRVFGWCSWQLFCQSTLPVIIILGFAFCGISLAVLFFLIRKHPVGPWIADRVDVPDHHDSIPAGKRRSGLSTILLWISVIGFIFTAVDSILFGRIPGWNLIAVTVIFIGGCFIKDGRIPIGRVPANTGMPLLLIANHLLLVSALYSYYEQSKLTFFLAAVFLVSLGLLIYYRRRFSPVYFIFLLAVILYSANLNAWWTTLIGDEYSQYSLSIKLAGERSLAWFGDNLFSAKGNFGTTPMLATYIQALFMKVFGTDGFGWRFSNAYLGAAGVVLFYTFLRKFILDRIALISALFLAASSYIISFGKIGYTNLQALFAGLLVLAVAAWALRSRAFISFYLLGVSLAFCFYLFPAALYVVPVPFLLLLLYFPPNTKEAVKRWGIMLAGMGMLVFPLFLQPDYWNGKIPGTVLATPNIVGSLWSLCGHIIANGFYAFFSFIHLQKESHFAAIAYADPISGILILIGFFHLLWQIPKSRFILFWMSSFLFLLLAVGVSHGYNYPPTTRMFLLLPWWMVFAAAGLEFLVVNISTLLHLHPKIASGLKLIVLLLVIGGNVIQAEYMSYLLYAGHPNLHSIFIRQAQEAEKISPGTPKTFLFLADTSWMDEDFMLLVDVYPFILGNSSIIQAYIDGPEMTSLSSISLADPNTIIFVLPFSHPEWGKSVDDSLVNLGKELCRIQWPEGYELVTIYADRNYLICRSK